MPLAIYGAQNLWPNLSDELGLDVAYYKEGNLRLGKTEAHMKILQGLVDKGKALGLELDLVSGDDARKINPYLSDEVMGAIWCPTDGHANPLVATLAFYKKARELGARYFTGEEVLEIRKV